MIRFVRGQAYFALDAYREAHNDLTLYLTIEKKYPFPVRLVPFPSLSRMILTQQSRKGTHTDEAQGHLAALQKIVDVCQTRMRV